ncbi:hypothetical protein BKA81DRAFT_408250 [Phyllosticta paracitricarpa]
MFNSNFHYLPQIDCLLCNSSQHENTCATKFNIVDTAYTRHAQRLDMLQKQTETTAQHVQFVANEHVRDERRLRDLSRQSQMHGSKFSIVERAYGAQNRRIDELERRVGDLEWSNRAAGAREREMDRLDDRLGAWYLDLVLRVEALEARARRGHGRRRSGRLSPDDVE